MFLPEAIPNTRPDARRDSCTLFHFERSRLNQLFTEAVRYPLVVVCAGAGYGKTSSVYDFAGEYQVATAWVQLSLRDNVAGRFWENFIYSIAQVNQPFAKELGKIDFPDTEDKFNRFVAIARKNMSIKQRIIVLDDFHCIEDSSVIRFVERIIQNLSYGISLLMISRTAPKINTASLISKGQIFNISESDLCFSENELAQYFRQVDISLKPEALREIMQDTDGWVFAINLIARSYLQRSFQHQKAPGYAGYLRSAMKSNIFKLMESEIWDGISDNVQIFLVRLSLIDHLSFDLILLLAKGDEALIDDLERQSAYVRRDSYINAYIIHPVFLEFLATKQQLLTEEQKIETYKIAGGWCNSNGFKIDALSYFEKIGDYTTILGILYALPAQTPYDIAKYGLVIFYISSEKAYDTVMYLALTHVRFNMRLGFWPRAIELADYYEKKLLKLPQDNPFRNASLGGLYLLWSYLRNFMCLTDDVFDFDIYLEKFCNCFGQMDTLKNHSTRVRVMGPWVNAVGSSKKGIPEEYIKAVSRASAYMPKTFHGFMGGEEDLVRGELKYFQDDLRAAERLITHAAGLAREYRQYEILHRSLLYTLRLSIAQGSYEKAEQALKEMKTHLDNEEYPNRYINYDISVTWYYCILDIPERTPDWLKQNSSPYSHASFIENFENQAKARYCYATRNYSPLLVYIHEMLQRESFLLGRVEMLAMEACVHYKMKEKSKAFAVFQEAYKTASPNDLVIPFIELGKDMRTLTRAALKEKNIKIPKTWLESINRRSATYAKRQAHITAEFRQANHMNGTVFLSPRESEILKDLSHGLSRADIASSRGLSINTVKMVINNVYTKLGAENLADLIRIAVERKMV
jgi:LuxR family maltose regulon positive regulatory protein